MSTASANQGTGKLTLGELLYSHPAITCIPEKDWTALVRAIAAGDESALRVLFEKTYPLVFTYLIRLTGDRHLTEDVVLDVFENVWCEAPVFDGNSGPVLGWIMRHARTIALGRRAGDAAHSRPVPDGDVGKLSIDPIRSSVGDLGAVDDIRLRAALAALDPSERDAMEAALLTRLAAQYGETVGTIKRRIRSGLSRIQRALQDRGDEP